MKTLGYILVGFTTVAISLLAFVNPVTAIEKAKYTVVKKEDDFEIRQYEAQIVAETYVEGSLKDSGDDGFRRLYAYISGDNKKKQSISMTAPVGQEASSQKIPMTAPVSQEKKDGQWRITFLMPGEYSLETLPEPLDERVKLKVEPGRLMAAVRYSGAWSEEGVQEKQGLAGRICRKARFKDKRPGDLGTL